MTTKTSVNTICFSALQKALLAEAIGKYACTEQNPCGVIFSKQDGRYVIADDQVSQSCDTFEDLLVAAQDWFEDFENA
jgi:hypothetical protein